MTNELVPPAVTPTTVIPAVKAAGAVLWRHSPDSVEVAVVHRPHYDDWSLPKGKLDAGETFAKAAVREVAEETGFDCVLQAKIGVIEYSFKNPAVTKKSGDTGWPGRLGRIGKVVEYFQAKVISGEFAPNNEVDVLDWLSISAAAERVSYDGDRDILKRFGKLAQAGNLDDHTMTVLLVRHAKAGSREDWHGDDDLRPLAPVGVAQAEALAEFLPLFAPAVVHSAPRLRCEETVRPIAKELNVQIESEPLLSEEGYWPAPEAGLQRFLKIVSSVGSVGQNVVICSQGGVIPDLVTALGEAAPKVKLPAEPKSKKSSVWALRFAVKKDKDPRLVSADYYSTTLPTP